MALGSSFDAIPSNNSDIDVSILRILVEVQQLSAMYCEINGITIFSHVTHRTENRCLYE